MSRNHEAFSQQANPNLNVLARNRLLALACGGLMAAGALAGCGSSDTTTAAESSSPPISTQPQEAPQATITMGTTWGGDGCQENYVARNNVIVSSESTDLCRIRDRTALVGNINAVSFTYFQRGHDPSTSFFERRGTGNDGFIYWQYRGGPLFAQKIVGGDVKVDVITGGADHWETVDDWKSSPGNNSFVLGISDALEAKGEAQAAAQVYQPPTYTTNSGNVTTTAQNFYQQRQAAASQEAQQLAIARNKAAIDQALVQEVQTNGKHTGILPPDCGVPGYNSCNNPDNSPDNPDNPDNSGNSDNENQNP